MNQALLVKWSDTLQACPGETCLPAGGTEVLRRARSRGANSPRLTNNPMSIICIWIDLEQHIVLRGRRLLRVYSGRYFRLICQMFYWPRCCSSVAR